jgi:predicted Zn-ribbon and HTH transcriptional regulator
MAQTRRQELFMHLEAGPATVRDLADLMHLRVSDVVDDLEHVARSLTDRQLRVEPARCQRCDYVFEDRRRLTRPSRCPRCRHERITWPVLHLE